ncbi:MAG: hypothetical protein J6Y93_06850 [Treponema sp.]|nr:hypothetical protein [Treponema sp.]
MELLQNVAEYYEELFPITADQKNFFEAELKNYQNPVKFLRIYCGTGSLEHTLSKEGHDVTGIEICPELIQSATRKRRSQIMFLRYFQMSTLDIAHFLGKGFYNIISILDNRIAFLKDKILIRKFFFDCKQLITDNGMLVIKLYNYDKFSQAETELPDKKSIRATLFSKIYSDDEGHKYMEQVLETGNGRLTNVTEDAEIYPLTCSEIRQISNEAGFSKCEFYSDFNMQPVTPDSDEILAVIS